MSNLVDKIHLVIRHGIISTVCATSELLIFVGLYTRLHADLELSYFSSFILATLIGFIGHSIYTFRVGGFYKRNAMFFFAQASIALTIGYLIISKLIFLGMPPIPAKIIQLGCVFIFNVTFGKFVSFKSF